MGADHHASIGMDLLSRYNLVIDYPGKRPILRPRDPAVEKAVVR